MTNIKIKGKKEPLIKNLGLSKRLFHIKKDFIFNSIGFLILLLFLAIGITLQFQAYGDTSVTIIVYIALGSLVAGGLLIAFPSWDTVLELLVVSWGAMFFFIGEDYYTIFSILSAGLLVSPSFQIAREWEKAVVFRLGKYRSLKGPGLFLIFPIIDSVVQYVDTRIRATDFRAETTLTRDTVPTNVDAIAFWMVWDAKKAVLEVENFTEAVILASQAALRDSIGKNDLAVLLSERERLGKEIQAILDAKTNPWGISILSIEISDIIIPKELEDAMSKQAQAERERKSRVILGTAEVEIAEKFAKASERYRDNPTALHLRAMNMIFEGMKKQGSIILLPSSAVETMSMGSALGTVALGKSIEAASKEQVKEQVKGKGKEEEKE